MSPRSFSLRLSIFNAFLFLGVGIQTPFLPLWLAHRGLRTEDVALVVALMTAIRIFSAPLGAFIADRTGHRRRVITACAAGSFLAYVLMGLATGFVPVLLLAVLAAAVFAPIVPLTEVLNMEGSSLHGLDYGRIRLWASLSFLSGNLMAGALLEAVPVSAVVFLIAAAHGIGAIVSLVLPDDPMQSHAARQPAAIGAIGRVLGAGPFLVFFAAAGIGQATHGFFYAVGSMHWDGLGYSKFTIGALWAVGVIAEVMMFAFSNRVFAVFGATRLIAVGAACGVVRWTVIGLEPALPLVYAAQALHVGSFALTHLGTMHFIRENVPAGMRNTVQGVFIAVSSGVLMSLTMWAAGPLFAGLGGHAYFVMAGCSAVALLFALALVRISPTAPAAAVP